MEHHFDFLKHLVAKGGPGVEDFYDLDVWIAEIAEHARNGSLTTDDMACLREVLGGANSGLFCFSHSSYH